MGRIIAIGNQKGGVGKTTTAVNLSAALAERNRKVLLIDIDPQANATSGVGVDKNNIEFSLYDVFAGNQLLSSVILETKLESLWIAPSTGDLVGTEVELNNKINRERVLKEQLMNIIERFQYIIIDCPPSLGLLTVNALVAADSLLVPLQSEYYALEGISSLMETVTAIRKELNPDLQLEGVVLTMYDVRTNLARQVAGEAKQFFADLVFETVIPRNVRISESPSFGQPILVYDSNSPGAESYRKLAEELEIRLGVVSDKKKKKSRFAELKERFVINR